MKRINHGYFGTKVYKAWAEAKQRCFNKMNRRYGLYGGRGITMCLRWKESFLEFLKDMGEPPTKFHSLGRINNDGNYDAENCRWETQKQQMNNTRSSHFIEFKGERMTIVQWERKLGIREGTLKKRILSGWTTERAISQPLKKYTR